MGDEMNEQMSEEITKAMDEQRGLEQKYAMLVKRRGELKGLSHKQELAETKVEIEVSRLFIISFDFNLITVWILNIESGNCP